jgi:hypothetical protein
MTELMWIRSHVERLLQQEWGADEVCADGDADYPFRCGTAMAWVRVIETEPTMVQVFAHAAGGMRPSLKLLRELNDIELRTLSSSVTLQGSVVLVSQTISPVGLTQPVLAQALRAVSGVADDIGLLLAGMFNGSTPFAADEVHSEEAS